MSEPIVIFQVGAVVALALILGELWPKPDPRPGDEVGIAFKAYEWHDHDAGLACWLASQCRPSCPGEHL